MDQDDLVYLSDQAQEQYNAFRRRFESDDWKSMVDWAEERATSAAARQLAASTWDQALLQKGMRQAFQEIVNLEQAIEHEFESAVAEAKAQQIAQDEAEHE